MDLGLKGRTVIVTGATGGIGREIARGYAAEGADVVLTYRSTPDEAGELAGEVGGVALPYELGDPASAAALVAGTLERTGRIDVLVNNAVRWGGPAPRPDASFEDVADGEWLEMLRHNIEGALRLSRLVAPAMRERRFGRLVHVSSSIATEGMAGGEYYGAAKGALHGFSRSAAFSLGRDGDILSNVVMPGFTRTARNGEMVEAVGRLESDRAPIGRLLDAAEVANAVVYLGSAANTGITGQVIAVNGGV
ncbi:SDR family NAD(P)-dependent oxidoreductase [Planomonospora venezuelensis]|uniref:NAD(P)-dependent dehydrogenase (Short-subunit alcohol dehydrogenase family) n=1 Tax=Planomonospora venezuelensis TaxID=1999 RepID=A0A841CR81_PLAVE|nr:SDR family oxidoreductase [Planomonospora venezuelensis]MBB5960942.1 NAD(P)-dependent dehydrogenase (short-subunit alcohol dehydrogenase family) [Planomonospora venezuelensis]GIN01176.1 beta-ketoacyl-ACP reductase [Planomonospora venezuelensis]